MKKRKEKTKIKTPIVTIVYDSKGNGLQRAYKILANKIIEGKKHEVRDICQS